MEKGYYFPLRNGGLKDGINDSGIETFKGKPLYSMTKETIQNSLDAIEDKDKPVVLEFNIINIDINKIPYVSELKKILKSCYLEDGNEKTKTFFKESLDIINCNKINILEVADYNTTGLKGATEEDDSPFNDLVKSVGVSNKDSGSGGSFGIGKNAPFACTKLRTVFYSTRDNEDIFALQGVCKLITHKNDMGRDTRGTGFLGIKEEDTLGEIICRPFINEELRENIDEVFIRKEVGTSLFLLGFELIDDWENSVIDATLDYYLVSILDNKLEVRVNGKIINKDTLKDIINKRIDEGNNSLTYDYYEALTNKVDQKNFFEFIEEDFEGLGKITLYVYSKNDLPKKIAWVRGMGMKIVDTSFRLTNNFVGVLKIEGEAMNSFIRSLENPSHDKIEIERAKDKRYANRIIKRLKEWMKENIKSIDGDDGREVIDVDVVGQYLPDIDSLGEVELDIRNRLDKKLKNVDVKENKKVKKCVKRNRVILDLEGEEVNRIPLRNEPKVNSKQIKEREINVNNTDKIKRIDIEKARIFCVDKVTGTYRLIVTSKNKSNALFQLRIIGEDGFDVAKIKSVKETNGKKVLSNGITFGPIAFNKGERKTFNVIIDKPLKYSMEVIENVDYI